MAPLLQKLQTAVFSPQSIPWILYHKFGTKFSSHILRTRALAPETVNIYPTFRCNLKCEMCFEKFAKVEQELRANDWLRIVDDVKKFHSRIHISGGESFVFTDIIKIIKHIKDNNLYLVITTNGTFLEEYAEMLVKFRVDRVDISIDGPEDVHDRIRGVRGTFNKILRGLEKVNSVKKHLPVIKINSIINFTEPETMKEIVALAQQYRASVSQFIYPFYLGKEAIQQHKKLLQDMLGREINYWCQASHYQPKSGDFGRIQSVIKELARKNVIIDVFPHFNAEQFNAYYNSPRDFDNVYKGGCQAMWNTLTILPDGSIESCPDYVVGNINKEKSLDAWNNQAMAELRKIIINKKFFSVCRACCFYYQ
ncbi:MAG: radical SAM/SPASM domain-containing protein [bacterium]